MGTKAINAKEQYSNTRLTQQIEYNGFIKTTLEWAKEFNITRQTLSTRFKRGFKKWPKDI